MGNLHPAIAKKKENDQPLYHNDDDVLLDREHQAHALYSYNAGNMDELSFEIGTEFELLMDVSDVTKDWILARNIKTGEEGYIPFKYMQCHSEDLKFHPAWFDITRKVAELKLRMLGLKSGTYLLRPCSKNPQRSILSLLVKQDDSDAYIKHFLIRKKVDQYFMIESKCFDTITQLLNYHSRDDNDTHIKINQILTRNVQPPARFAQLDINRERLVLEKELGHGEFGEIYLGRWNNQIKVAVKSLKVKENFSEKDKNCFLESARIMQGLIHPHIVQILAVCTKPNYEPILILKEFMEEGCIKDFLNKDLGEKVKLDDLYNMMSQICDGMEYLEGKNLVHRNLRASNIFIDAEWKVKVSDFGLSLEDEFDLEKNPKFPIKWTPLEVVMFNEFSIKSDVYSFGMVMYEMITYGLCPFPNNKQSEMQNELENGIMPNPHGMERSATLKITCPDKIYDTMKSCWNIKSVDRPTFCFLKNYFENIECYLHD